MLYYDALNTGRRFSVKYKFINFFSQKAYGTLGKVRFINDPLRYKLILKCNQ